MKVTMLRNPAKHFECRLAEGQTGEVEDELAEKLINLNIATPFVKQDRAKLKGVAEEPEIKGQ